MPEELIRVMIFPIIIAIAALITACQHQAMFNERRRRKSRRAVRRADERLMAELRQDLRRLEERAAPVLARRARLNPPKQPSDEPFMAWLERKYIGEFKLRATPRAEVQPAQAVTRRFNAGDRARAQRDRLRNTPFAHYVSSV